MMHPREGKLSEVELCFGERRNGEKAGMGSGDLPDWQSEVFGGMWDSDQLHWTGAEAVAEIEDHVVRMGLLPMEWTSGEGDLMVGRTHYPGNGQLRYAVLVRSVRLPKGEPPDTP